MWEWQILPIVTVNEIPTQFKDEMEQAELLSPQLVNIEVSLYPFFPNMKTEIRIESHAKTETKKGNSYRKTIAAVFFASLFKVRDNQRPNPNDVAHNIH